jgi:hypothetical protein
MGLRRGDSLHGPEVKKGQLAGHEAETRGTPGAPPRHAGVVSRPQARRTQAWHQGTWLHRSARGPAPTPLVTPDASKPAPAAPEPSVEDDLTACSQCSTCELSPVNQGGAAGEAAGTAAYWGRSRQKLSISTGRTHRWLQRRGQALPTSPTYRGRPTRALGGSPSPRVSCGEQPTT